MISSISLKYTHVVILCILNENKTIPLCCARTKVHEYLHVPEGANTKFQTFQNLMQIPRKCIPPSINCYQKYVFYSDSELENYFQGVKIYVKSLSGISKFKLINAWA